MTCASWNSRKPKSPRWSITGRRISRDFITAAATLDEQWLPSSGESRRDAPIFFHYVNVGPNVREHEMITDVYLPLK